VTLDGRDILSGATRQRALTEYWNDPNNNPNIPTWASVRTAAFQYTEYYDSASPAAGLSQTLRAARQCVGASCP
jgi:hypothetical protein